MPGHSDYIEEESVDAEGGQDSNSSSPQKEWGKKWPEGVNMGKKSQLRARKKPPPNPVWLINWRDPSQSVSRSNNGQDPQ